MQKAETIAIQYPKIAVPTRVRGGLRRPSIDLGVDQQGRRYFVPVPAVMWRVLMVAFDLAGIGIKRERRVRIEIIPGPVCLSRIFNRLLTVFL